ncbi:MMPL family transporter [Streptomyces palmae]|uniref:Membrane transport protein MMPL domain-containing protein n=1 Tax=Streptomyces palmae TaxID=1701085 RepID=A0A4Z0GP98_9ACTN|nr:hypothetical protein E4099_23345 [Streptomyces palmae]
MGGPPMGPPGAPGTDDNTLVSDRIHQEIERGVSARAGVAETVCRTAPAAVAAGLGLAGSFPLLAASPAPRTQETGTVTAFGVLLSPFIVSVVPVSALAALPGRGLDGRSTPASRRHHILGTGRKGQASTRWLSTDSRRMSAPPRATFAASRLTAPKRGSARRPSEESGHSTRHAPTSATVRHSPSSTRHARTYPETRSRMSGEHEERGHGDGRGDGRSRPLGPDRHDGHGPKASLPSPVAAW